MSTKTITKHMREYHVVTSRINEAARAIGAVAAYESRTANEPLSSGVRAYRARLAAEAFSSALLELLPVPDPARITDAAGAAAVASFHHTLTTLDLATPKNGAA